MTENNHLHPAPDRPDPQTEPVYSASLTIDSGSIKALSRQAADWFLKYPQRLVMSSVFLPLFWVIMLATASFLEMGTFVSTIFFFFFLLICIPLFYAVFSQSALRNKIALEEQIAGVQTSLQSTLNPDADSDRTRTIHYSITPEKITWNDGRQSLELSSFDEIVQTENFTVLTSFHRSAQMLVIDRQTLSAQALNCLRSSTSVSRARRKKPLELLLCILLTALIFWLLTFAGFYPLLGNIWLLIITALVFGFVFFVWILLFPVLPGKSKFILSVILVLSLVLGWMVSPPVSSAPQERHENPGTEISSQSEASIKSDIPDSEPMACLSSSIDQQTVLNGYLAVLNSLSGTSNETLPPFQYTAKGDEYIVYNQKAVSKTKIFYDRSVSTGCAIGYSVEQYSAGGTNLEALDTLFYLPEDGSLLSKTDALSQGGDLFRRYQQVTGQN